MRTNADSTAVGLLTRAVNQLVDNDVPGAARLIRAGNGSISGFGSVTRSGVDLRVLDWQATRLDEAGSRAGAALLEDVMYYVTGTIEALQGTRNPPRLPYI